MANYKKQFNFRNGVQVDDDNFIVSPTGLVGIGTTVPTEAIDAYGNARVSGFLTATSIYAKVLEVSGEVGIGTLTVDRLVGAGISISGGIVTASDSTGIVTYYGDARYLQGMPTSQWVDTDVGLGYTSIYAAGNVGVGTTDPRFTFQVGGNTDTSVAGFVSGVGISSTGNLLISGITTAHKFVGIGSDLTLLDADNITSGTVTNDRLPVLENSKIPNDFVVTGVITATRFDGNVQAGLVTATSGFTGNLTGTASTALSLSGVPNIVVGILTANAVAASSFIGGITGDVTGNLTGDVTGNVTGTATTASSLTDTAEVDIADMTVGVATVTSDLFIDGRLGIGTDDFTHSSIAIRRDSIATLQLVSDTDTATISIGRSMSLQGFNGAIRFGESNPGTQYSESNSFDLINYADGNFNYYLQAGSNVGLGTGSWNWIHKQVPRMTLTYEGNLGIGLTLPTSKLHVDGSFRAVGVSSFQDNVDVDANLTCRGLEADVFSASNITSNLTGNVNGPGISTVQSISVGSTVTAESLIVNGGATHPNDSRILTVGTDGEEFFVEDGGVVGIGTTVVDAKAELTVGGNVTVFNSIGVATDNPRGLLDLSGGMGQRDFSGIVGVTTNNFMLPPMVSNAVQTGLVTFTGAIVYNTDANKLRVYTGNAWEDLH